MRLLARSTCDYGYAPRNPSHPCTTTSDTDYASAFDPSEVPGTIPGGTFAHSIQNTKLVCSLALI